MEMNLLTIKEYAQKKNVSYEAVRKQIQKYKDNELKDHIIRKNKTQYLDEYAVDFLDNRRRESPIMVIQMDKDEEIERLTNENKALLVQIAQIQDELIQTQKALSAEKDTVKQLQAEKIALLEAKQEIGDEQPIEAEKKPWWRFW